jgi:hypothetical protein
VPPPANKNRVIVCPQLSHGPFAAAQAANHLELAGDVQMPAEHQMAHIAEMSDEPPAEISGSGTPSTGNRVSATENVEMRLCRPIQTMTPAVTLRIKRSSGAQGKKLPHSQNQNHIDCNKAQNAPE